MGTKAGNSPAHEFARLQVADEADEVAFVRIEMSEWKRIVLTVVFVGIVADSLQRQP